MDKRDRLYIDGSWVPSTGKGSIDVISASTEEVIGTVPEGTAADVDNAVAAARTAFLAWSATPVEERAKYLQRLQEGLSARMGDIANIVTAEVGMPPGRYVDRVRLETARRRLEDTADGVEQTARSCGYGTPEAMRRAFVRALGVSPGEYRRRFRSPVINN